MILYEKEGFWVKRAKNGLEVYQNGLTHSTRVARIGYEGDEGLERAKNEIERRLKG